MLLFVKILPNYMNKIKLYIISHKIQSALILLVILLLGYWGYKKITGTSGNIRYITAKVVKGTVVAAVSGTGQVSGLNQIDIKPKVSGNVISIRARNGNWVSTGETILELDPKDAQKTVRDAEISLESAKISLDKLKIQNSNENMNANLIKAYGDAFNTISSAFLDTPGIMTGLSDMFFKSTISNNGQWNIDWYLGQVSIEDIDTTKSYKQSFVDTYNVAQKAYNDNLTTYKSTSRNADTAVIEKLISQTYDTIKLMSDAIKNANNYIDFVNVSIKNRNVTPPTIIATNKVTLTDYTNKTNIPLTNLLAAQASIKSYKDAFPNSSLDVQSAMLSVKQKENALQDAKDKLADYFVSAPFPGTITNINIKNSDAVSLSTVVGTLITAQQLALISLNEIDVAKIKIGQKATLTFDAVPDLAIPGVVSEIDSIGTVSQGVVTYNVKITFGTQDKRVKPAMSVSASIITDTKQDVLVVQNSAIKSQSGKSYIEIFDTPLALPANGLMGSLSNITPRKIPVTVGLSNNSESEITSGLKEGEEIVVRIITPSAGATASTPSIFGSPNRGGGNAVRVPNGK